MLVRNGRDFFNVYNIRIRIAQRLGIEGLRVILNRRLKIRRIAGIYKSNLEAPSMSCIGEQIIRATVQVD